MIEVGEYIRTEKGEIGKLIKIDTTDEYGYDYYICDNENATSFRSQIVKHSKNIIDLIEVGDIVEIYDVLNEDIIYIWNEEMLKAVKEDVANGIKIRRILTKELFEANCYKVKEEIC